MAPGVMRRLASRITIASNSSQHRAFHTSIAKAQVSAKDAAARLMDDFGNTSSIRRQAIDGNQLQKLAVTLGRPHIKGVDVSENTPAQGTPIPHGYHLVYFTPNGLESKLGADGSDRTYNPPSPFTRRMWAGGKMKWTTAESPDAGIRVGDEAEERTKLLSATPKKSRSGSEMVLVEVEKEIWGPRGLAMIDQRSWIFRPEIDPDIPTAQPAALNTQTRTISFCRDVPGAKDTQYPTRLLSWSPVALFRFSALTFNGHKIHYSEDWTRQVEGHPGTVVHGPLNLINMLDYWHDIHGDGRVLQHISYRALQPVYAGDRYHVRTCEVKGVDGGDSYELLVEKEGTLCMKAEILGV